MSKLKYWEFNIDKFSNWVVIIARSKEWALGSYLECCGTCVENNIYPKEITESEAIEHYEWYRCVFPEWENEHEKMLKEFHEYSTIEGFVLIC